MGKFLAKLCAALFGLVAQLVGLLGTLEPQIREGGSLSWLPNALGLPVVYIPTIMGGTVIMIFAFGQIWADHVVSTAGGISKLEFKPRSAWNGLQDYAVWQVAWLWNDLEPQGDGINVNPGSPVYATWQQFKEHLDKGMISGAAKVNDSWSGARLSRQQLIDYAIIFGVRPPFLYARTTRQWLWAMRHRAMTLADRHPYQSLSIFKNGWMVDQMRQAQPTDDPSAAYGYSASAHDYGSEFDRLLKDAVLRGQIELIGRVRWGEHFYGYSEISPRIMSKAEWLYDGSLQHKGHRFGDIHYKFTNKKSTFIARREIENG